MITRPMIKTSVQSRVNFADEIPQRGALTSSSLCSYEVYHVAIISQSQRSASNINEHITLLTAQSTACQRRVEIPFEDVLCLIN